MTAIDTPHPYWSEGLPLCDDRCPLHDGKRCMAMGFRPDRFCEPTLREWAAERAQKEPPR